MLRKDKENIRTTKTGFWGESCQFCRFFVISALTPLFFCGN